MAATMVPGGGDAGIVNTTHYTHYTPCTHTLYSYTVLILLHSYSILTHCTHPLYSYTVLILCTHTLYSYSVLDVMQDDPYEDSDEEEGGSEYYNKLN
jgi:hypothetical protein